MKFERPSSALQHGIRFAWVMFIAFLALSGPAHAVLPSETAAVLFQVIAAALVSGVVAGRGALARRARRATAALAEWTREREVDARAGMEGAERLGSRS